MDAPKVSQLFKAVNAGDVARLRELLAAGLPVDSRDSEQMTPVMRAAERGNVEAFRVLVEAGADLHSVGQGFSQTDLLECAASGGNAEIVRFLLEKGLPVEGHWKPRSNVSKRMGHITPLIAAAMNARVEIVEMLLKAGADREAKIDGQTAQKIAEGEAKFPVFPGSAECKPQYLAIAAMLADKPGGAPAEDEAAIQEVAKFAVHARKPTHQKLHQLLEKRCGQAVPWKPVPDHGIEASNVFGFTLADCDEYEALNTLLEEIRLAGSHAVLTEPWTPGEEAKLALFPTGDKYAVVAAMGTQGANYGVRNADVIGWLRELESQSPFLLRYCGHDLVGGDFVGTVKNAKKLADRMVELCPSCLDEGFSSPQELSQSLKKNKWFLLRWD